MSRSRADLGLVLIVLAAFVYLARHTGRVNEWFVMTDELQNAKLAVGMATTFSPVPRIHGEYFGALSVLYPLVTAPFYGVLAMPDAFRAVHFLNAALMASAAVPAYLLTRAIVSSPAAARLVAALTVLVPWAAMALMLMTESAAYPAFLWALLAFHRAAVAPSPGRDAVALAALVFAFFARTQFVVLAAVLPAMVLAHEVGYAVLREPDGAPGRPWPAWRGAWPALRRGARAHTVLLAVSAVAALLGAVLAATGSLGSVLGSYEVTASEGSLLPRGIHHAVVTHLDFVIVALGVVPFVLGAAWIFAAFVRPLDRASHAFAVMSVATIPLLAYEVASFNLRFANGGVQDRYLFYMAPLLFIGMAAWLADDRRRVAIPVLVAGVVFAWVADFAAYAASPGPYFGSPSTAFHQVLDGQSQRIGTLFGVDDLAPATLIAILTLLTAAGLALVARSRRIPGRILVPVVGLPVLVFGALETSYVLDHMTTSSGARGASGRPLDGRDWIDRALPDGATAGLIPSPEGTFPVQALWWETELFNKEVDRAWAVDEAPTYTPFPIARMSLERDTGRLRAHSDASDYLVMSERDRRFQLAGEVLGRNTSAGMILVRAGRAQQTSWASRYIDGSNGNLLSKAAAVRVYGSDVAELAEVRLKLTAPPDARRGYVLAAGTETLAGSLAAGRTRTVRLSVCVGRDGFEDVAVRPRGRPAPEGGTVAVHEIAVRRQGSDCVPT